MEIFFSVVNNILFCFHTTDLPGNELKSPKKCLKILEAASYDFLSKE